MLSQESDARGVLLSFARRDCDAISSTVITREIFPLILHFGLTGLAQGAIYTFECASAETALLTIQDWCKDEREAFSCWAGYTLILETRQGTITQQGRFVVSASDSQGHFQFVGTT